MHWRFEEDQGDEVCIEAATLHGLSFPVTLAVSKITKIEGDPFASVLLQVCIEAATLDGLSFPVTLAYAFYKLRLVVSLRGAGEVRVILIGAAARTEERVLLETNYWAEVGDLLPDIDKLLLCLVGPEVCPRPPLPYFSIKQLNSTTQLVSLVGVTGPTLRSIQPPDVALTTDTIGMHVQHCSNNPPSSRPPGLDPKTDDRSDHPRWICGRSDGRGPRR
eukprot:1517189-Pyramimonas_sp.AAC.1